jgi:hypothetical protein
LEAMVDANQTLAFTVTVPVIERFVSFLVWWFVGGCLLLSSLRFTHTCETMNTFDSLSFVFHRLRCACRSRLSPKACQ